MAHTLVNSQNYPNIKPSEDWMKERLQSHLEIIEASDRSFRNHSTIIHANDEMWQGLQLGQESADPTYLRTHYFFGGRSAIKNISEAMISAESKFPRRILDFPCGHGRVTRFLRTAFPDAALYAGDLSQEGVDFACAAFDAIPVYSQIDLDQVDLPDNIDLIWCSSLATHLREDDCVKLFTVLANSLAPGGIAGVTLCGRGMHYMQRNVYATIDADRYEKILIDLEKTGFGYQDYPNHDGYGMAYIDLRWLQKVIYERNDITILSFKENAWHGWQDIVWIQKKSTSVTYDWNKAS